jgi:hypothetical protein
MLHHMIFIAGMQFSETYQNFEDCAAALKEFQRNYPEIASTSRILSVHVPA